MCIGTAKSAKAAGKIAYYPDVPVLWEAMEKVMETVRGGLSSYYRVERELLSEDELMRADSSQ